jgi:hypothetical protein
VPWSQHGEGAQTDGECVGTNLHDPTVGAVAPAASVAAHS